MFGTQTSQSAPTVLRTDFEGQHQVDESVFFVIVAQCRLDLEMGFSSETIQYTAAVFTG